MRAIQPGSGLSVSAVQSVSDLRRRRTSDVSRERCSPGFIPVRVNGPSAIRRMRRVGCPTAAVIFRTCLLRPSVKVISSHVVATFFLNRIGTLVGGHRVLVQAFEQRLRLFSSPRSVHPFLVAQGPHSSVFSLTCTRYVRVWP